MAAGIWLAGRRDRRRGAIKGVAGENLRKALDWLPMGRQLVTVKTDCDLDGHMDGWPGLDALKLPGGPGACIDFYASAYGFKDLAQDAGDRGRPPARGCACRPGDLFAEPASPVADAAQRPPLRHGAERPTTGRLAGAAARGAKLVAFDTETDSLDEMRARIVGISFADRARRGGLHPAAPRRARRPEQLPLDEVLAASSPGWKTRASAKIGQNIKYDRHVFANHGIDGAGLRARHHAASYVLEAHKPARAWKPERHLGRRNGMSYEDLCGKGAHQIPLRRWTWRKAGHLFGEDEMTLDVHEARCGCRRLIDAPARCASTRHRDASVGGRWPHRAQRRVDRRAHAGAQSHELASMLALAGAEAYEMAGQPFNLGSPKQIGEISFGKLGLPVVKKTATGARSTDEEVLANWPRTTRCPPRSWSTEACPSSRAPTPTSCR